MLESNLPGGIAYPAIVFAVCIAFASCTGTDNSENSDLSQEAIPEQINTSTQQHSLVETYSPGQRVAAVQLADFPDETYTLYLPISYNPENTYPVIMFFDPHADGMLPINKYSSLADKYNFILAGSNRSENGMSLAESRDHAAHFINDVMTRLPIDKANISLCGFSGGAKVALTAGDAHPDVSSVVYCGAATKILFDHSMLLLGFAGKRDMNYLDVILFDSTLPSNRGGHYLVEWDGGHEFPDASAFENAFKLLATGKIDDYEAKQPKVTQEQITIEQRHKQQYMKALRDESPDWWKTEIASINRKKANDLMYERLSGFVSLACYTRVNTAMRLNRIEEATRVLEIYEIVDPDNPEVNRIRTTLNL